MAPHRGFFWPQDLEDLNPDKDYVVLASGGPLMEVDCVEGDMALCSWWDQMSDGRRVVLRRMFQLSALRKMILYKPDKADVRPEE